MSFTMLGTISPNPGNLPADSACATPWRGAVSPT
jgi:hypothetical protein